MHSQSETAQSALETWRLNNRRLDLFEDTEATMEDFERVWASAHKVVELAKTQSIPLEEVVRDEVERNRLESEARAYNEMEEMEDKGWPSAEDPPEDDGMTDEIWLLEP